MKKIFSTLFVLFALAALCFALGGSASAADGGRLPNGLSYEIQSGQAIITDGKTVASDDLIIPSTIEDYPVTSIAANAFYNNRNITSVTIPDSVTHIGYEAFQGCSGLETVNFPANMEQIETGAFYNCSSLRSITLPEGLTCLEERVFSNCEALETVSIPDGITQIGDFAFAVCKNLETVTIPDSVTSLGYYAFQACSSLKTVSLPENLKFLGGYVFSECSGLESIVIPQGVTEILDSTFYGCSSLKTVTLPDSIASIGSSAFRESGLTSVKLSTDLNDIDTWAFEDCMDLKEIIFTSSAPDYIHSNAFFKVDATVYYPDELDQIKTWTPDKCNNYGGTLTWKDYYTFGTVANCQHTFTDSVVAPSCTSGYTLHTCACGFSYRTDIVEGMGHDWDEGVVDQEPTLTTEGIRIYTCIRCDETRAEVIPALWDNPFQDVLRNAWYYEAVAFCNDRSLIAGTDETQFSPDASLDRSMLVTILYRYEGKPGVSGPSSFTDVPTGEWYSDAIAWAQENRIVAGVTETTFAPFQPVTREQMAAIFYRYAAKSGIGTDERASLDSFADASRVSSYAKDAISWCVARGILSGSNGKLNPQSSATRAEFASILMRYITKVAEVG